MAVGGDHFLRRQDRTADGAVLALRQAGLRAGGGLGRVDDLGMAVGGDHFLRCQDLAADGAVLTLCQAGLCAGGGFRRVDDLGMRELGDHLLRLNGFAAGIALLALRQSGGRTGGRNGGKDLHRVDGQRLAGALRLQDRSVLRQGAFHRQRDRRFHRFFRVGPEMQGQQDRLRGEHAPGIHQAHRSVRPVVDHGDPAFATQSVAPSILQHSLVIVHVQHQGRDAAVFRQGQCQVHAVAGADMLLRAGERQGREHHRRVRLRHRHLGRELRALQRIRVFIDEALGDAADLGRSRLVRREVERQEGPGGDGTRGKAGHGGIAGLDLIIVTVNPVQGTTGGDVLQRQDRVVIVKTEGAARHILGIAGRDRERHRLAGLHLAGGELGRESDQRDLPCRHLDGAGAGAQRQGCPLGVQCLADDELHGIVLAHRPVPGRERDLGQLAGT